MKKEHPVMIPDALFGYMQVLSDDFLAVDDVDAGRELFK